ncbi:DUF2357 domain-containing protein [Asanoa sp. NPDC049573]|uniref:DUF2357 domain-containing protein n=1 Tax=Asanoa sp. NPDC049573 TaxID=3155396 RepID=UPI00341C86AF
MASVSLPLRDATGEERGSLVVWELPRGAPLAADGSALLEARQYRYEVNGVAGAVRIEPAELFNADDSSRTRGRITPKQHVGTLGVVVECADTSVLSTTIEVLPTKLGQVDEYRHMLSDITSHAAEAALRGFAPTTFRGAAAAGSAELLYQRFALLESQLYSDRFGAAIARILSDPDVEWRTTAERQSAGGAYPGGSAFGRAFAAPGPRRPWLAGRDHPSLTTMPAQLERSRQETTPDTGPNRFVKYALETWRALAQSLRDGLGPKSSRPKSGPARRGLQAANGAIEILDDILGHPLFREVGSLDRFPSSSQVLQKRAGYRQLLRMFVLVDAGLELPWTSDVDDIYSPSLRNVADLYEIWCYLTLLDIVGEVCAQPQVGHPFVANSDGLSLKLRTGLASTITWQTSGRGRPLEVRLMFNRTFAGEKESWTRSMRPDCSLLIRPSAATMGDALDVWVHFDAKYKVDGASPIVLAQGDDDETPFRGEADRDDLLKMHAYRDAIHRTAGAYILYPGDEPLDKRQFTETLPGLGAFPLRPGADQAYGVEAISTFLASVLDHVADQATQHERERYWRAHIYGSAPQVHPTLPAAPFLDRPPADTDVLLGYVRGAEHRGWIEQTLCYNVRADGRTGSLRLGSRELGARLLLLYEQTGTEFRIIRLARSGDWRAIDRSELSSTGYPSPRGRLYLVTTLEPVPEPPPWLADIRIDVVKPDGLIRGAPFAVTWLDLMSSVPPTATSGAG